MVYVNWTMIFTAIILGLVPIYLNGQQQEHGYPSGYFANLDPNNSTLSIPLDSANINSLVTDDYVVLLGTPIIISDRALGPFLGLCLPALLDLFVEFYVSVTQPKTTTDSIIRLTMLERMMFIVGVIFNDVYFLIPLDWNVMVQFTIRFTTTTMANVLLAPIIIFLERTTNVFSPFFTTLVLFLLALGNVMVNFSYVFAHGTLSQINLNYWANIVVITSFVLILSACVWSFLWFLYNRQRSMTRLYGIKKEQYDPFLDFSVTNVPACHMFALCVNVVIAMCFNFGTPTPSVYLLWYAMLVFSTALVFVVEMRVRQNEVVIGLRQLVIQQYEVCFLSYTIILPHYYLPPTVINSFFQPCLTLDRQSSRQLKQLLWLS